MLIHVTWSIIKTPFSNNSVIHRSSKFGEVISVFHYQKLPRKADLATNPIKAVQHANVQSPKRIKSNFYCPISISEWTEFREYSASTCLWVSLDLAQPNCSAAVERVKRRREHTEKPQLEALEVSSGKEIESDHLAEKGLTVEVWRWKGRSRWQCMNKRVNRKWAECRAFEPPKNAQSCRKFANRTLHQFSCH